MLSMFTCGDSFNKEGDVRTWARQVAVAINAEEHNFAVAGTTSAALIPQFDKASDCNAHIDVGTVAIVGGGLGDLLQNFEPLMKNTGMPIFSEICENKQEVMRRLHSKGVKHFVVTSAPLTTSLPYIRERLVDVNGCTFGEAEVLVTKAQETLSQMTSNMAQKLLQEYPDMKIIIFQEVKEIEKWRAEDSLFDALGLHPNDEGHTKLAKLVLDLMEENGFPIASEAASESQIASAPTTPQVAPAPAGLAETPSNPTQADATLSSDLRGDSLDDKFGSASEAVRQLGEAGVVSSSQGLIFYKLYKQATEGDNTRPEPNRYKNFGKDKACWSAWSELKGKPRDWAKQDYVNEYLGFASKRRRT